MQFTLYACLVCRSGSKGYCWPALETIIRDTGIRKSSLQKALKILKSRKFIAVQKYRNPHGYANNEYRLLSLENPEVYRESDTLPLMSEERPA